MRRHLTPLRNLLTFEEWLATTSYSEARKDELREVHAKLRGARPNLRRCRKNKAFVKNEFYVAYKQARMINSRVDEFKAWSGRLFKSIEEEIFKLPWFVKHIDVDKRAEVIDRLRKSGLKMYITDHTSYEAHFSPEFMRACELDMYSYMLGGSADAHFICKVLAGTNISTTRAGIKAKVKGTRMSGDMCTSLGNGWSNFMMTLFICSELGCMMDGIFEGDDGLVATNAEFDESDFAKLGFTIKMELTPDARTASFCGLIFGESGETIRDPRKFLQGFGWSKSFIGAGYKIRDELLRAKALSTCYETPQCPIVSAMAHHALTLTRNVNPRFVNDGYHPIPPDEWKAPVFSPTIETRQLFASEFGVSIETQLAAESAIYSNDMAALAMILPPSADSQHYASRYIVVA